MTHVDDVDRIRAAMMEYAEAFFAGVRAPPDLYERFRLCFNTLRDEMAQANTEGRVSAGMAEAWSWYSVAVPAMLYVIFTNPKWGTRQLELDLNEAFVKALRQSKTTTVTKSDPADPAGAFGVDVDENGQSDPADRPIEH